MNEQFPIQKSSNLVRAKKPLKYPFDKLEVGQSFFINLKKHKSLTIGVMRSNCTRISSMLNKKFRAYLDKEKQIIEVARLPDNLGKWER